jgi:SAM-dependent methyltransferase
MILDVGCGSNPKGDINIDAFPNDFSHHEATWNPKNVKNFVLANAHSLPFRDNVFRGVLCSHTLEHLEHPLVGLREMNRVCDGTVQITIPSQFDLNTTTTHLYTWNPKDLRNLLSRVFREVTINYKIGRLLKHGRLARYIPFIDGLLSKVGFHPEIQAICKTTVFSFE